MKNTRLFSSKWFIGLMTLCAVVFFACEDDEDMLAGPSGEKVTILNTAINEDIVTSGVTGIPVSSSIKIFSSHALDPEKALAAFSFTGASAPDFEVSLENSSSAWVITLNNQLEFETAYSIAINSGVLGAREQSFDTPYSFSFTTGPFVPPSVSISANTTSILEASGTANVTATLAFSTTENFSITLGTDGTASASDFILSSPTIDIPAGSTTGTIQLTAMQDGALEGPETVILSMASASNAAPDGSTITFTIIDDDKDSNGDGSPDQGLIINEVLFDPASDISGDANGDGQINLF